MRARNFIARSMISPTVFASLGSDDQARSRPSGNRRRSAGWPIGRSGIRGGTKSRDIGCRVELPGDHRLGQPVCPIAPRVALLSWRWNPSRPFALPASLYWSCPGLTSHLNGYHFPARRLAGRASTWQIIPFPGGVPIRCAGNACTNHCALANKCLPAICSRFQVF